MIGPGRRVHVTLTDLEALHVDELRRLGGFVSDADVIRCGLFHVARHFDLAVPPDVFAVGQSGDLFAPPATEASS